MYRESLEVNPKFGDAWFYLAECSYYLGEADLALEYVEEALKYSRNYSEIQNLKGMTLISLGRLDEARDVFKAILASYPNDVKARFGLAELDLFNGSLSAAEERYLDALKRDGTNRKALLSLALVSAAQGKDSVAERYILQALKYHSGEAEVHYLASYLEFKRGDLTDAEHHARAAMQIKGDFDKAYELLSAILYEGKRYTEVIDLCEFRIGRNRNLSSAWYLMARSFMCLGETEKAIQTFTTGLSVAPEDEIMRLALEQLVDSTVSVEDSRREQWALFHLSKAKELKKNFDGQGERYEYQKALSVDPLNQEARQKFADMLYRDGLNELYLEQLKFIKENFTDAQDTSYAESNSDVQTSEDTPKRKLTEQEIKNADALEGLESLMQDNLSHLWNVESFYLDKTRWNIGIYYIQNPAQIIHPDSEAITAVAAGDIFKGNSTTEVDVKTQAVKSYGEAYRNARSAGRDYFVILSVEETERTYALDAIIYSARTGTKTGEVHAYSTGNDRVSKALRRFRQAVLDMLPIRGRILNYTQDQVLLDVGKSDGITKGAVFDVVKRGSIVTNDSSPGVFYKSKDVLGSVTVDRVDEEISQGTYVKKGFYDILNTNDEVVLISLPDASGKATSETDVRPQANSEGEPVTEEAKRMEREALKESLSNPRRESDLIRMIESVY